MRFCRFRLHNGPRYGLIQNVSGQDLITHSIAAPELHVTDSGVANRILLAPPSQAEPLSKPFSLDEVTLLTPLPLLSKVICVGRNYKEHVNEMGNEVPKSPLIFFKPPSSVISNGEKIVRPKLSQRVDHEGELGVVIGRTCYKVGEDEDVRSYILGYTCVNDVTARDLQKTDGQWARAKGFDTFCPVGPAINTELDPWNGVKVETRVNGKVRQTGTTADFIFPLDTIIRYISSVMTLLPGDIIATGTPAGVSPLQAGDTVEIAVEGVGVLKNPVVDE